MLGTAIVGSWVKRVYTCSFRQNFMEQSHSLEANSFSSSLYGTLIFISCSQNFAIDPCPDSHVSVHILIAYSLKIHFKIILLYKDSPSS
jgi:hypothetical protein